MTTLHRHIVTLGLALFATVTMADTVRLHSAGSLRAAMTEISAAFSAQYGTQVQPVYGASGSRSDRAAQRTGGEGGLRDDGALDGE